jgi:hypothetical protein
LDEGRGDAFEVSEWSDPSALARSRRGASGPAKGPPDAPDTVRYAELRLAAGRQVLSPREEDRTGEGIGKGIVDGYVVDWALPDSS